MFSNHLLPSMLQNVLLFSGQLSLVREHKMFSLSVYHLKAILCYLFGYLRVLYTFRASRYECANFAFVRSAIVGDLQLQEMASSQRPSVAKFKWGMPFPSQSLQKLEPMVFIVVTLPHPVPLFCMLRIGISDYFDHILRNNWSVCMCELKKGD